VREWGPCGGNEYRLFIFVPAQGGAQQPIHRAAPLGDVQLFQHGLPLLGSAEEGVREDVGQYPEIFELQELGIERCASLRELAEKSDVVTVHLALEPSTRGLFGAEFFARMKPGAAFINTSRGGLHDEAALIAAMTSRGLRAGLDVYAEEPGGGTATGLASPIFSMKGFVGSHHVGASTDQAQDAIATEAVRVCRDYVLTGRARLDRPWHSYVGGPSA